MTQSSRQRLDEIEQDLLSAAPLADCLRKCIALGLALRSDALKDWATRELDGYPVIDDLPAYRRVPVNIIGDVYRPARRSQPVPISQLPEALQATTRDGYPMPDGVATVSAYVEEAKRRDGFLALAIPDSLRLAAQLPGIRFTNIWYRIDGAALDGLLGRVRTHAIHILHEIRGLTPEADEPTAKAANQAVNVQVTGGKGHQINVTTNQAQNGNVSSTAVPAGSNDDVARQGLKWTKRQTYWTIVGVILTVIVTVVTLLIT
jgi:hypothetical protein